MFNIIFPVIIFISLAVIVFIIGKHLPEFVDIRKKEKNVEIVGKKKLNSFFKIIFGTVRTIFLWLTEKSIQKIKNFLNLIQSWVLENKKDSKDEVQPKETVDKKEFFGNDFFSENDQLEKKSKINVEKKEEQTKLGKSFSTEKKKLNPFSNFKNKLKEKILDRKRKKINQVFQEEEEYGENDQFSDGIVKIHEKSFNKGERKNKKFVNEVIEIKKVRPDNMSLDDEIGVDRNILENKLIGKISKNPRDKELYRQLGELYIKMENYLDAEGCYKQILKISVRDSDAVRKIERIKLLKRSRKSSGF